MTTVRLTWDDLNADATQEGGFRVYRSPAPLNQASLPAPLVDLTPDTLSYDDAGAPAGINHYLVSAYIGVHEVFSLPKSITLGGGAPATLGTYQITIPSGSVGSDLIDFPVMVDLADMPSSFWVGVRGDGGNIRAYAADGITPIPLDVTHIDGVLEEGRLFVKRSISALSDTVFVLTLLNGLEVALAPDDANGQYAVWSGYEAVVVFPEEVNRADGAGLTHVGAQSGVYPWKEVAQQSYTAHQGVSFDGTYHYAVDTNYLRKYSTGTTIVASNSDPVGDMKTATGEAALNHCGSPSIVDGELWTPIEAYPKVGGSYDKQYIGRFALSDMSYLGYIELTGATRESSALAVDDALNRIYVTDYTNGASIPYFDKATGAYLGAVPLSLGLPQLQGITEFEGGWLVSGIGYPRGPRRVAKDGTVGGYLFQEWYAGNIEGVNYHPATKTVTFDKGNVRDYRVETGLTDWRRQHGYVSYHTVPSSGVWTVAVSWRPTPSLSGNNGVVGVNETGNTGTSGRTAVGRRSNGTMSAWNSSNGWLGTGIGISYYTPKRVGFQHDGTVHRKIFTDGAVATDLGVSQRPSSGANMDWFFGAANSNNTERNYGEFQFAWCRSESMSEDWMAADADNMNAPSSFYSIAEL